MVTRRGLLSWLAAYQGAEFRVTSPVVLSPVVVQDPKGAYVRGLNAAEFIVFDSGVLQTVQMEPEGAAVSLVLALHASREAAKPLHRLRQAVSLFGPLVAGANGQLGLVAFREDVEVKQPLTADFGLVERDVKMLVAEGYGGSLMDAIDASARLLAQHSRKRRKVIVAMGEDRDCSSKASLSDTLALLQQQNITVYFLTYSPGLMRFGKEVPTGP